jgi:hypothetical protein
VEELNAVRDNKIRKATAEMLANSTNIWLEAAKNQRALTDTTSTAGLEGPQKELLEMNNKYNDSLADTVEKYKKLNVEFLNMGAESKTQYLLANPDVKQNSDGSLDFTKRITAEQLAIIKDYNLQVKNYHMAEKQYEYDFDAAMQSKSIAQLQAFLSSKEALEAQDRAGQTAAMEEYYTLWVKTHKTALAEMVSMAQTFDQALDQALESLFEKLGDGVKSMRDTFSQFAKSLAAVPLKDLSEKLSGEITSGIFGGALGGGKKPEGSTSDAKLSAAADKLFGAAQALQDAIGSKLPGNSVSGSTSTSPNVGNSNTLFGDLSKNLESAFSATKGGSIFDSILNLAGFATGGVASGWAITGEQGPEIVNFSNPGRVYTAAQTREMLGGGGGNTYKTHVPISVAGAPNPRLAGRLRNEVGDLVTRIMYEQARM